MDSVGNEDDGDILGFLKVLDQPEELRGFRVAQGRGWLVQNQEITFVGYGAGDENHLLLREGEVLHQRANVDVDMELLQHPFGVGAQLSPVHQGLALCGHDHIVEHHVFSDGERRHQRHIHFLIHDLDAQLFRGHGRSQLHNLVVEIDLAGIVGVCARKDLHQSGFARSVRAHERPDFAGADFEVYIGQRLHTGKFDGNIPGSKSQLVHGFPSSLFLPEAVSFRRLISKDGFEDFSGVLFEEEAPEQRLRRFFVKKHCSEWFFDVLTGT